MVKTGQSQRNKMFKWIKTIVKWAKVGVENVSSLPEHAKIGLPFSIFFIIFGVVASLIFKQWWLFICASIFYIGILIGFEVKQWNLQEGKEKIKFWLQYKFIDSCCDVVAGSWLTIIATGLVIIFSI